MRIMVTGGAGFIGSHIADAYLAAGHEVLVLDALTEHGGGKRQNVAPRALFVHMDIRDEQLARIFQEFRPEVVSHHAAQASVAIGSRDPILDAQVNVVGLLNVLENSVRHGVQKIIYASSGAIFGTPEQLPMNERTPQRPESPYGITKMVGEHYLRFFAHERGLDFTSLRYGNVYGPRQDPNGEAGVIAIFIGRFLAGADVRIDSDGEQTRDYVYVGDVAAANLAALERGGGGMYCIGTNKRTSVNQIYRALCEVAGFEAPVVHAPKRPGDARDAQFDYALAKSELGWAPQTDLRDGIRATYDCFKDALPAAK
jgi:UDP-glucose 4-epimerase